MRIGLFTDTYPPYINGVSTSTMMLKKALEKEGNKVYVVTVNPDNLKFVYDEKEHILRMPGIPTGIYDYRLTEIYSIKALSYIKKWHLDIIHTQTEFGVGTFARVIAKQYKIPLVHTYHTMYEDYIGYITKGHFDKPSKKLVEYFTKFYCDTTVEELIVPTKKTYELFKEKYNYDRNIHIIPTGIEIERFYDENINKKRVLEIKQNLNIKNDDFVILYVGRLGYEKSIDFLIDAQATFVHKNPKCKLVIVGDGPDLPKFEKQVKKLKIEENVIFTGKVPWEDVPFYYNICTVFSTASKTETQGLTVIEAMAAGRPVICIDDESFRNVVINGLDGYLFKNKKEYKKIILNLFDNKETVKKLGNQARISSEVYSSKYFAKRAMDVYKLAIGKTAKKSFKDKLKEVVYGKK